jgi:Cys-tRNA(Pro)/Cys-tRNA(Cys) deacylase
MTPAVHAATVAGIAFDLLEYAHHPDARSYGLEAASALGLSPSLVFKTLIAKVDGRLIVALVPVDRELDLKALAAAVAGKRAEMTPLSEAERVTGYVAGGISVLGQRRRLPTVIDESARLLDRMCVSAGRRGLQMRLAPADLVALTAAAFAPISRV